MPGADAATKSRLPQADAIVVGSGPNGLAAAIAAAQAGLKPLVIEQAATVGGGVRSAALTLPGFVHDVCSAIHRWRSASPVFPPAGPGALRPDVDPPAQPAGPPLDDGTAAVLERSVADTAATLGAGCRRLPRADGAPGRDWDELPQDILGRCTFRAIRSCWLDSASARSAPLAAWRTRWFAARGRAGCLRGWRRTPS